ncbi:MAG: hypothetical protein SGPRY_001463 [Prymnesium sp.]
MPPRPWNPHTKLTEHEIPPYTSSSATRRPAAAPPRPLISASDNTHAYSEKKAMATGWDDAENEQQQTVGVQLSTAQEELYTALFGEPPKHAGGAPPHTNAAAREWEAPHLPNLEASQQVDRAVKKAMRGAALERRQAVEAALAEAEKEKVAALSQIREELEEESFHEVKNAVEQARQKVEEERQQALREMERDRERAVSRAVEAAEQRRDRQWQACLWPSHAARVLVFVPFAARCEQVAEQERERAAAAERNARRLALKQREALVEKTSLQALQDIRSQFERASSREIDALKAEHAVELKKVRETARAQALAEAEEHRALEVEQAVSAARQTAAKEKREAVQATARECEAALQKVMAAAAEQQATALAEARRQWESELLDEE